MAVYGTYLFFSNFRLQLWYILSLCHEAFLYHYSWIWSILLKQAWKCAPPGTRGRHFWSNTTLFLSEPLAVSESFSLWKALPVDLSDVPMKPVCQGLRSSLLALILCHSCGLLLQFFLCRCSQPISISYSLNTKSAFIVISDPLCVLIEAPSRLGPGPHTLCPTKCSASHTVGIQQVWPWWLITCMESMGDPSDGGSMMGWWLWQGLDWSLL